jgi:tRNA A64-2'-O-ribosylphosphate transferase
MSEGGYIQGGGDDSEGWSLGLTPETFWGNKDLILRTSEDELPKLITFLKSDQDKSIGATEISLIKPTQNVFLCKAGHRSAKCFGFVITCSDSKEDFADSQRVLNLRCPGGKLGSRDLRKKLPEVQEFLNTNIGGVKSGRLLITCSTGKDLSVGVALLVLCIFCNEEGRFTDSFSFIRLQSTNRTIGLLTDTRSARIIDKQLVRERLAWIITSKPDSNPSRSTLQAVNSFLIDPP